MIEIHYIRLDTFFENEMDEYVTEETADEMITQLNNCKIPVYYWGVKVFEPIENNWKFATPNGNLSKSEGDAHIG